VFGNIEIEKEYGKYLKWRSEIDTECGKDWRERMNMEIEGEYGGICDTRRVRPASPLPAPIRLLTATLSPSHQTPLGRSVNKSIGVWVYVLSGGEDFNKMNTPRDKFRVSERGYVYMRETIDSNSTCSIRVKQRASTPPPPSVATLYNFTNTHY
jgi:hypothetical protein